MSKPSTRNLKSESKSSAALFETNAPDAIFQSKNAADPRLSSFLVNAAAAANVHIWGYADDEGIKLNGGRVGAAEAPLHIRKAFYKMTPGGLQNLKIWDPGNFTTSPPIAERHRLAANQVQNSLQSGKFLLTLGGGHDYGYPDGKGFIEAFKKSKKKPVVLNFDAHMDVRPLDYGLTSGTPFYRLIEENGSDFHFFEIGIQEHCNSQEHIKWCEARKGKILYQKDIEKKGLAAVLKAALSKFKGHPTFISVDIDGFSSAIAPGCSQSWPTGFEAREFFEGFEFLFRHLDVKNVGIYEVSPPLDLGPLTSRLAALILYRSLASKKGLK